MMRLIVPLLLLLSACRQEPSHDTRFTLEDKSNIQFRNNIQETKEFNVFKYRNFYNGGGVATGDLNNDGLADVFLLLTRVVINYTSTKETCNLKTFLKRPDFQTKNSGVPV